MDYQKRALEVHEELKGKLSVHSKIKLLSKDDLSIAYTPGVAQPCLEIAKNPEDVYKYTIKGNTVAVISDGSAVLGLGNIGARAAIPVMEGKALLLKELAGIDAFPICLESQDVATTIQTIRNIAPVFGGINLEDFKAPECFVIEDALQDLGIPVMHDDQHGSAVVVLAAVINAMKATGRTLSDCRIVVLGAGAAGTASMKLLYRYAKPEIIAVDSKGILSKDRQDLNEEKKKLLAFTNPENESGNLSDAVRGADIFIGVSIASLVSFDMVKSMEKDPIIIAMANPVPEIMPDIAKSAGASIVATGRSDFPNQVNNSLAFPGIFRGALDARATRITEEMKIAAAEALASLVPNPNADRIIPYALDKNVAVTVAKAVKEAWEKNKG